MTSDEFQLDLWERPDSWGGKPWYGWYVGLGRTRDSDVFTRTNFEVFLKALRELPTLCVDDTQNAIQSYRTESEDWTEIDSVFVVRENHWAHGWIEWIAIHPSNEAAVALAKEMLLSLADYPVLDEDALSENEYNEVVDWWYHMPLKERVERCAEADESIFAARHDHPPMRVYYEMRECLYY